MPNSTAFKTMWFANTPNCRRPNLLAQELQLVFLSPMGILRLRLPSPTSLAIPAAISFALFTQPILVEASLSQFPAYVSSYWSLADFAISAAIAFALLPSNILVFTGTSQLLALPTSAYTDAT